MKRCTLVVNGLLILCLQACSPGDEARETAMSGGEPQHVWKEQVKALEKAQNLEQDMNQAWQQRNRAIDGQTP